MFVRNIENALPLIVTHGWPGSIIEQLKIIDPLTDPTAHGASASDAFDLVIPSMPGYGFSGKPTTTGWDPERIARAWIVLMKRLGYTQYVAQGGDWGDAGHRANGACRRPGIARHPHQHAGAVPADVDKAAFAGGRRRPASRPTRGRLRSASPFSTSTALATPPRWRTARRRCTGSRIRQSASPPGCSTTTLPARRSSRASSTVSPRASRATTSSTTSRSTG